MPLNNAHEILCTFSTQTLRELFVIFCLLPLIYFLKFNIASNKIYQASTYVPGIMVGTGVNKANVTYTSSHYHSVYTKYINVITGDCRKTYERNTQGTEIEII